MTAVAHPEGPGVAGAVDKDCTLLRAVVGAQRNERALGDAVLLQAGDEPADLRVRVGLARQKHLRRAGALHRRHPGDALRPVRTNIPGVI